MFDPETKETFHNQEGAFTEALSHFVVPSKVSERLKGSEVLHVLDVCFGLGYNSFALICEALSQIKTSGSIGKSITIYLIENDINVLKQAASVIENVPQLEILIDHFEYFIGGFLKALINKAISKEEPLVFESPEFKVTFIWLNDTKDQADLHSVFNAFNHQNQDWQTCFDLIYYDPFSPATMPELWTAELFESCYKLLNNKGTLMTYSSAGSVRGGLIEAGFYIMKSDRLGERSGGTVAIKDRGEGMHYVEALTLDPLEAEFLATTATIPFRNKHNELSSEQMILNRRAEQAVSNRPASEPIRQQIRKVKRDQREKNK